MTAQQGSSPGGAPRAWPVVHNIIRGVLALALVVLVVVLVLRHTAPSSAGPIAAGSPTASATPSRTPSATPSSTPTPTLTPSTSTPTQGGTTGGGTGTDGGGTGGTAPAPPVVSFDGTRSVTCTVPGEAPVPGVSPGQNPVLTFSWTSTGADTAYFGVSTRDAQAEPYSSVGLNDSISIEFQCPNASELYTVTMVGAGGKTSKTIEVVNGGYTG